MHDCYEYCFRERSKQKNFLNNFFYLLSMGYLQLLYILFIIFFSKFSPLNYGFSNFYAFLFGSISSFLGNKFFVFKYTKNSKILMQVFKFCFLYLSLAILHGIALYWWSDINNYNYITGFI